MPGFLFISCLCVCWYIFRPEIWYIAAIAQIVTLIVNRKEVLKCIQDIKLVLLDRDGHLSFTTKVHRIGKLFFVPEEESDCATISSKD